MKTVAYLKRLRLGINHLWPLVVLAGLGFYTSLVPLPPNDFWWHLKIGELISTTGSIPTTNIFAWTLPVTQPFTYGAWLGEYLFYQLYLLGGVELLLCTRTVLLVLTLALVGYEARRRTGSWRLAALPVLLVGLMSLNNLIVRPQIWSWLPFMTFYLLLSVYADGGLRDRWLWLLPLVMTFWVNAHGAFVLGPVLLGIFLVGEGARTFLRHADALPWRQVRWLAVIFAATLLATAVNPQFTSIYGYVWQMMTDAPSQGLVVEWQSPAPHGIANLVFFASVLLLFLALVYSRFRPTLTQALLLAAFLWLAWSGQRYVIWFGLVTMPLLAQALCSLIPARYLNAPSPQNQLNLLLAVLLWLPVVLVQPWWVEDLPLPESYWDLVWRDVDAGPLLDTLTPWGAVEYLRAHPGGQLFNEMGYGSYLIWALPAQKIFVDPRVELYPLEQWQNYLRISRGVRYNELLAQYGVDRLLLDRGEQSELILSLADDSLWELEHEDEYAQIWKKN